MMLKSQAIGEREPQHNLLKENKTVTDKRIMDSKFKIFNPKKMDMIFADPFDGISPIPTLLME